MDTTFFRLNESHLIALIRLELGERLWADYQEFIKRDLGEYGIAERWRSIRVTEFQRRQMAA